MLIKISYLFQSLSRPKEVSQTKTSTILSHQDWVRIDKIVIGALFLAAIVTAILTSL